MSLTPIESVQLNSYFQTGNFSTGSYYHFKVPISGPPLNGFVYYDRLGAFIASGNQVGPALTGILQFDPLFLDNTSSLAKFVTNTPNSPDHIGVGEWNRLDATQPLYGGPNVGSSEIWPIDQSTLVMTDIGSSLYPFFWDVSSIPLGTIGGWDEGPAATTRSDTVFMETWGYAIRVARVRHTDGNLYRGLCQVDLMTGAATLLDVPAVYTTSPAALFETYEFQGDTFNLDGLQFVPDDDSVPAAPKGRVFMHSSVFLSNAGNVNATDARKYLKIIEWNPLGVTATPGNSSRVHLREQLLTRLNFIERQAFGTNPNSLGISAAAPVANGLQRVRFHPPTRTFVTIDDHAGAAIEERGYVRHTLAPALAEVQPPTALTEVETAKTVRFRSRALGDIGDVVGGIPATWTLVRRSTVDEALDTVGLPATSTVENAPIDTGSLVVEKDDVPLTITTDYTVVEATGVITWAGSHPSAESGYTASYRHTATDATPAHGVLLQQTSRTDELGLAETRIRYEDDDGLVDQLDYLTCEMSDD